MSDIIKQLTKLGEGTKFECILLALEWDDSTKKRLDLWLVDIAKYQLLPITWTGVLNQVLTLGIVEHIRLCKNVKDWFDHKANYGDVIKISAVIRLLNNHRRAMRIDYRISRNLMGEWEISEPYFVPNRDSLSSIFDDGS